MSGTFPKGMRVEVHDIQGYKGILRGGLREFRRYPVHPCAGFRFLSLGFMLGPSCRLRTDRKGDRGAELKSRVGSGAIWAGGVLRETLSPWISLALPWSISAWSTAFPTSLSHSTLLMPRRLWAKDRNPTRDWRGETAFPKSRIALSTSRERISPSGSRSPLAMSHGENSRAGFPFSVRTRGQCNPRSLNSLKGRLNDWPY